VSLNKSYINNRWTVIFASCLIKRRACWRREGSGSVAPWRSGRLTSLEKSPGTHSAGRGEGARYGSLNPEKVWRLRKHLWSCSNSAVVQFIKWPLYWRRSRGLNVLCVLPFSFSLSSNAHCYSYINEKHRWISLCLRDASFPPTLLICWQSVRWFWTMNCENAEGSGRDLFSGTATVPIKTAVFWHATPTFRRKLLTPLSGQKTLKTGKTGFFETICTYQIIRRHILDRRVNFTRPSLCLDGLRRIMKNLNLG
jgi:hypothetical protein